MSSSRILIVTPGHACRNPRPQKEADALARAGYDVTLLSIESDPILAEIDREIASQSTYRQNPIRIPNNLARRGTQWLGQRAVSFGFETVHALGPSSALLARVRRENADLTIVHNEVPHWIGSQLLNEGKRVAADIEDWHSEDLLPQERRHRPLRLLRRVEGDLLRRAAYTSTTSDALADALFARYGGTRPHVITNSFPLQPAPQRSGPSDPPTFFWFSQTLGSGRGLELFLSAWKLTRHPSKVVLLGETRSGYDAHLLSRLPEHLRGRIGFLPLVSPTELPALIARYDIGLALEQSFIVNRDLTITNKIIQYLNAGLAIVASNTAGQREILARDPEIGIITEIHETTAFAKQLDEFLSNRELLARRQHAARQLAESCYCWEREAPRLVEIVADALSKPSSLRR